MKTRRSNPSIALARMRLGLLRNLLSQPRKDSLTKTSVVILGIIFVIAIGYQVALHSFRFIEKFPVIGVQMNSRIVGFLFLILLGMVTISTAIVVYTSLFLGKETAFFFENPLPPVVTFFVKAGESIAFSGWATVLLCIPLLVAFGIVRGAPGLYYLEAFVILVLFVLFCGFTGTGATLLLLTLVRRWTFRKLFVLSSALMAFVGWSFLTSFDFAAFNGEDNLFALNRFTMNLATLQSPFVPSNWAATGILAATTGQHGEVLFQMGLLLANTLIFFPMLKLYGNRLYGRRWVATAEPAPFFRQRRENGPIPEAARANLLRDPGPMGSLIWKDLKLFLRDPAQISQFVLFLVLTAVYVLSLIQIPSKLFISEWRLIIHFSNLAAISLILSSFTSRFLFPLISMEGKAFWIVGLAPLERAFLVRQKVWFGRFLVLSLGLVAAFCSSLSLKLDPGLTFSTLFTVALSGWVLTALAVGFGAAYPNLLEDNPARIAVGLGGTLNFFASATAVTCLLAIEGSPYVLIGGLRPPQTLIWSANLTALAFSLLVSQAAIRLGERSLVRMDF